MESTALLQLAVAIFVSLAGGFGVGKLLSNRQTRGYEQADTEREEHDKQNAVRESNNAHKLEADGNLITILVARVQKLETDVQTLQTSINSQMAENANIKAENRSLQKDNERMEKEITALREDNALLRHKIEALEAIVTANGIKFEVAQHEDPLKVQIVK